MTRNPLSSILRDAWTPADRREPWRWCEDHIKSIPYSPLPGPFRSENSPWIREVMEAIVDPKIRLVSIIAAVQSSKTTSPELTLCYIIANLPEPCLWLDQTDEDAKDESESRLQKLFESCEPVKKLFPKNKNKQRNCTIHFSNGMTLWLLGAYNKTNLQRRSIRWLFGDETWRWPVGHMAEAEARTTAFGWLGEIIAPPFAENEVIAPLRIMSVDVQMNCFYLVVRAWSINGSSRLLWHEKVLTWEDIEEIQKHFRILDNLVFVDAGYNSFEVYKHCGERNWIALMGDNRANFFHRLPNGKTVLRFYSPVKHIFISRYVKCRMHFWSNLNVKDTLARIRRNQNPADGATWEVPTDISEDYLKQMESEHRIKKGNSWIWEQIGNRPNHYLDCEAMNCAGALMLKIVGNG